MERAKITPSRIRNPILCGLFFMLAYLPFAFWFATMIVEKVDFFLIHPIISMFLPVIESIIISWGFIFLVYSRFKE